MKIVLYGSESSGKTTLAKALAKHFDTTWVPEYARDYLQKKYDLRGEICSYSDLMPIAQGQLQLEKERQKACNHRLLFCDTNVLQTYYYGKAYYANFKHKALWNLAMAQTYDFYFLTDIDTPWEADDLRDRPNKRQDMHRFFKRSLEDNNLPYMLLNGSKSARLEKAVKKVEQLRDNVLVHK